MLSILEPFIIHNLFQITGLQSTACCRESSWVTRASRRTWWFRRTCNAHLCLIPEYTRLANGKKYYAFVFEPSLVVLRKPLTDEIVFKRSFARDFEQTSCQFTSLVTFGSRFYAGLSDGGILTFHVREKGGKFECPDSKVGGLPGYNDFSRDLSEQRIEILG